MNEFQSGGGTAVAERPQTTPNSIELPDINIQARGELVPKSLRKESRHTIANESDNTSIPLLTPKDLPGTFDAEAQVRIIPQLEKDFAYYSRTHDLEVNTERTELLQGYVNKMFDDAPEVQTRVVIMNKGKQASAFIYGDGTIFINQALINRLDSIDEVVAVLAHEVNHYRNNTSAYLFRLNSGQRLGAEWFHEAAADDTTPHLLEKVGLNSTALAPAIQKIAQGRRGDIAHMGDISRASSVMGIHRGTDFDTSNIAHTPLPETFHKDEVEELNSVLVKKAISSGNVKEFKALLPNLHPTDLNEIKDYIKNHFRQDDYKRIHKDELVTALTDHVIEKLEQDGYSTEQVNLYLSAWDRFQFRERMSDRIKSPEELLTLATNLQTYQDEGLLESMNQQVFLEKGMLLPEWINYYSLLENALDLPANERNHNSNWTTIQVDTFMDSLSAFNSLNLPDDSEYNRIKSHEITELVTRFIDNIYLNNLENTDIDLEQIDALFEELQVRNIQLDKRTFLGRYAFRHDEQGEIVQERYKEFYHIQEESDEKETEISVDDVDAFFDTFSHTLDPKEYYSYIATLRYHFKRKNMTSEQVADYADRFFSRINTQTFSSTKDVSQFLETCTDTPANEQLSAEQQAINDTLIKFNLKLLAGVWLFKEDSKEFYDYVKKTMESSGIDLQALSTNQILNLTQTLFLPYAFQGYYHNRHFFFLAGDNDPRQVFPESGTRIGDRDEFLKLPFISELTKRTQHVQVDNLADFHEKMQENFLGAMNKWYRGDFTHVDIFDSTSNLYTLAAGGGFRKAFTELLERGVDTSQYEDLRICLDRYFPDMPQKKAWLRQLHKHHLTSESYSLDEKTQYLKQHFPEIGIEGMQIIGNQLKTIPQLRAFKEEMHQGFEESLKGSEELTKAALGEFISSMVQSYDTLFRTCQSQNSEEVTNQWAMQWLKFHMGSDENRSGVVYDDKIGKFKTTTLGVETFISFQDLITTLQNLSDEEKVFLAHQALTGSRGALNSKQDRKELGVLAVDAVGGTKNFSTATLQSACEQIAPEDAGLPLAQMFAKSLFSGLDSSKINIQKLKEAVNKSDSWDFRGNKFMDLPEQELLRVLTSETRPLLDFDYINDPNSLLGILYQQNNQLLDMSNERLDRLFRTSQERPVEQMQGEIRTIDAVITGAQAIGAPAVRGLQLGKQVQRFPDLVEARLQSVMDTNPGISKGLFMDNFLKQSERLPELQEFIENKLVTIDEYLGGGSLYTTFAATIHDEDGQFKKVAIKMLNPNAAAFVERTNMASQATFADVQTKYRKQYGKQAELSSMLMGTSSDWCMADINDQTFARDDEHFRDIVAQYNGSSNSETQFSTPKTFLSTPKIKIEEFAEGITLNKLLSTSDINPATKQEAVKAVSDFFAFQFQSPANQEGEYILHSDPHEGNYIIKLDDIGRVTDISVIDRNMYLHIPENDLHTFQMLRSGDSQQFFSAFVDKVLDNNNKKGFGRRRIKSAILARAAKEYASQRFSQVKNDAEYLRILFSSMTDNKLQVPLSYWLMIRNIQANKSLNEKIMIEA